MHAPLLDAEIYDQIRETARRFAEDVVKPAAADLDRDETFPAEIYARMGELGLFGIQRRRKAVQRGRSMAEPASTVSPMRS